MACGSCGSGGCSTGGCGKNGGCATGGCNKLNTFDWLGNMLPPTATEIENVYEVRFKNTHKGFYRNVNGLRLNIGDFVVVEGDRGGFDIGQITLGGVLAQLQMSKKYLQKPEVAKLYRKANENDLKMLADVRALEPETTSKTRIIIQNLRLDMKLSDVEYQGDGTKAIFYYIADFRVDFRELIKLLAREFKVRVEMRQIGLRHEAGLLGGIGVCGRELCCATWLTEFKVVTTSAARYQNLSLNPAKISGLCGRLKCCLNFELDTYKDALKDFPNTEKLMTERGWVYLQKTDIFKYKMWFSYEGETTWYPLDVADVKKFAEMNSKGQKCPVLSNEMMEEISQNKGPKIDFVNVVGNKNLQQEREDGRRESEAERENRNRRKKKKPGNNDNRGLNPQQENKAEGPKEQRPEQRREQRPEQRRDQRPDQRKEQRPEQRREQKPEFRKEQPPRPEKREQQPPINENQPPRIEGQGGNNQNAARKRKKKRKPNSPNGGNTNLPPVKPE